jgi:hypothetical protein
MFPECVEVANLSPGVTAVVGAKIMQQNDYLQHRESAVDRQVSSRQKLGKIAG